MGSWRQHHRSCPKGSCPYCKANSVSQAFTAGSIAHQVRINITGSYHCQCSDFGGMRGVIAWEVILVRWSAGFQLSPHFQQEANWEQRPHDHHAMLCSPFFWIKACSNHVACCSQLGSDFSDIVITCISQWFQLSFRLITYSSYKKGILQLS